MILSQKIIYYRGLLDNYLKENGWAKTISSKRQALSILSQQILERYNQFDFKDRQNLSIKDVFVGANIGDKYFLNFMSRSEERKKVVALTLAVYNYARNIDVTFADNLFFQKKIITLSIDDESQIPKTAKSVKLFYVKDKKFIYVENFNELKTITVPLSSRNNIIIPDVTQGVYYIQA